ncbi:MAG: leucine-rich repeat protein [Bacilli bacterium]|nr:leucine-rich repeat protein [Bacilli bacterium]
MSEEKKKRNKIIGISIGILVVLLVVISSTYAYWQITKSQDDPNKIIAACLDFNVDFPVGITEENKWPMSSSEAMNTIDGYTFTVTNNCPEDVTYVVGLESVTSDNIASYLSDASVGIGFDGVNKGTYSSLTDLEGPTMDARGSKKLQTAIVKGKSDVEGENVNTHNLKLWIDESSDVEEQSKGFSGKLFITGGQKVENDMPNELTAESCFEMNGEEIIDYKEDLPECGDSVVIPATVNDVAVKTIDSNAFRKITTTKENITYYDNYNMNEIEPFDKSSVIAAGVIQNVEDASSINWSQLVSLFDYGIIYSDDENDDVALREFFQNGQPVYYDNSTVQNFPGFESKDFVVYVSDLQGTVIGVEHYDIEKTASLLIKELDLSQAYNLEKIEEFSFANITDITSAVYEDPSVINIGLTKLVFGNTDKELVLGKAAFVKANLEELTTYTNLVVPVEFLENDTSNALVYVGPFAFSTIGDLNILPTDNIKNIYTTLYPGGLADDTLTESVLYMYISSIDKLTFGEGMTEIPGLCFAGGSTINEVNLPNSLISIGASSFRNVKNLRNVALPNNVEKIGEFAFSDAGIETITMSQKLKTIERYAFAGNHLTNIVLPQTIQEIGARAFSEATGTITMKGRTNLSGLTLGSNWEGNATVVYD